MPAPVKTWKIHPAYVSMIETLQKKGAMTDTDLFESLNEEYPDLGFRDFNELLMRLEVAGKIRVTSAVRNKRRVENIG